MKTVEKVLKRIVTYLAILAGIALVGLMLVTVADVLLRALFSTAIMGSIELSVAVMVCAGFLGMAWCALNDNHIKVDIVVGMLPFRIQKHFFKFNYFLTCIVCALVSVQCYKGALDVKRLESVSQLLRIPIYPFYILVSVSYLLLSITALFLLVKSFITKDDGAETEGACVG